MSAEDEKHSIHREVLIRFFDARATFLRDEIVRRAGVFGEESLQAVDMYVSPSLWDCCSQAKRMRMASRLPQWILDVVLADAVCVRDEGERAVLCQSVVSWDRHVRSVLHVPYDRFAHALGGLAHDLRSPLVTVRGYADMMASGSLGEVGPDQEFGLQAILRGVSQLDDRLEMLGILARMYSGRLDVHLERCDVVLVAEQVVEAFQRQATSQGTALHVRVSQGVRWVHVDRRAVLCVLREWVRNALRATTRGEVLVELLDVEGGVEIAVRDTGRGIAAQFHETIFEPFVAGTDSQHSTGRVGMGLAVVQGLVRAHQSRVDVESNEGAGARFAWVVERL